MVRIAKKEELERVNEIKRQVARLHSNGRPDIFRDDFSKDMQNLIYSVFENENSDVFVVINNETITGQSERLA